MLPTKSICEYKLYKNIVFIILFDGRILKRTFFFIKELEKEKKIIEKTNYFLQNIIQYENFSLKKDRNEKLKTKSI